MFFIIKLHYGIPWQLFSLRSFEKLLAFLMCGSFLDFNFGGVLASTFTTHALKNLSSTKEFYERHASHKTLNPKPQNQGNQYIKKKPHMNDKCKNILQFLFKQITSLTMKLSFFYHLTIQQLVLKIKYFYFQL
jgi:uncharacterized FlaG/YvyC family protein